MDEERILGHTEGQSLSHCELDGNQLSMIVESTLDMDRWTGSN